MTFSLCVLASVSLNGKRALYFSTTSWIYCGNQELYYVHWTKVQGVTILDTVEILSYLETFRDCSIFYYFELSFRLVFDIFQFEENVELIAQSCMYILAGRIRYKNTTTHTTQLSFKIMFQSLFHYFHYFFVEHSLSSLPLYLIQFKS